MPLRRPSAAGLPAELRQRAEAVEAWVVREEWTLFDRKGHAYRSGGTGSVANGSLGKLRPPHAAAARVVAWRA